MKDLESINKNKKSCKDIPWICLFLTFWCFLIIIILFAMKYGNYAAVINGADSFGNICNQKHNKRFENFSLSGTDTSQKSYLFYFDFKNIDGAVKLCVENCPLGSMKDLFFIFIYQVDLPTQLCFYDMNVLKESTDKTGVVGLMSRMGPCPSSAARCLHFKNRCIPYEKRRSLLVESYDLLNAGGLDQLFFIAVYQSWNYVAVLCLFAFGISMIILAMMFWLPKFLPWMICLATIITNVALSFELWPNYNKLPYDKNVVYGPDLKRKPHHVTRGGFTFYENFSEVLWDILDEFLFNDLFILYLTFLSMGTTIVVTILILIWMIHFNELKVLFDEAANCMKNLPGLIIAPTIALVSMILLIFLSGYTLLCITTAKIPEILPTNDKYVGEDDPFKDRMLHQQIEYVDLKEIRQTFWIFIIGMLWTAEFIFAFEEFCIGAAVGFWYSTPSIKNPSLQAIGVLFKYHLGTIAKGSAVIALFKVPRIVIILIFRRIKSKSNQLWLRLFRFFEKRIEIWNHNAYVPAAMEAINLRQGADVAWKMLSKNAEQIENINNVFGFVLFVSKFFVAILTCLFGIKLLKDRKDYLFNQNRNEFFFYTAPVVFSSLCAFSIAHIVFSVFEMTVDTLLLSSSQDHQKNGRLKRFIMKFHLNKHFESSG